MPVNNFANSKMLYREEIYAIQGAIFNVYREMGAGFLEAVYQECLEKEFSRRNIPSQSQKELLLSYKGEQLTQRYKPDFICYDKIILELKIGEIISQRTQSTTIQLFESHQT